VCYRSDPELFSTFYADLMANVDGNYTVKLVRVDDGTVMKSASFISSLPQVTDFGYPSGLPDTVPGGKFYLIKEMRPVSPYNYTMLSM